MDASNRNTGMSKFIVTDNTTLDDLRKALPEQDVPIYAKKIKGKFGQKSTMELTFGDSPRANKKKARDAIDTIALLIGTASDERKYRQLAFKIVGTHLYGPIRTNYLGSILNTLHPIKIHDPNLSSVGSDSSNSDS